MVSMAEKLSSRMAKAGNPEKQLKYAFKLLYSREPAADEVRMLSPMLNGKNTKLLAQALLMSNEFSYID